MSITEKQKLHMKEKRKARKNDWYPRYDLKIVVLRPFRRRKMVCRHKVGDYFELKGEELSLPPGQTFCIYALAALVPFLPVKQRPTHKNDWITTDDTIACPDPRCGGRFQIIRIEGEGGKHSEDSAVPLPS